MHYNDVYDDKGVALPEVYAIALSMEPENCKWQVILQEFINEQAKFSYCEQGSPAVGVTGAAYNYDRNGLLTLVTSIDGSVQKVISTSLRARLLYPSHYPLLVGHQRKRPMYKSMWREYFWPHMENNMYTTLGIAANAPETSQSISVEAHWSLAQCKSWDHLQRG